jgi:four helix bundle protein
MAKINRFEDLEVWQKARELAQEIYSASKAGLFSKDFGLRDQIRRAAVSIMANIAEGFERGGDKEFIQFLALAKGSCGELRAQLYVALDQNYVPPAAFDRTCATALEISRMLSGLIRYLRQSDLRGSKYKE